jgi:hypothetical protein
MELQSQFVGEKLTDTVWLFPALAPQSDKVVVIVIVSVVAEAKYEY